MRESSAGAAQLSHVLHRHQSVSDDVADRKVSTVLRQRHQVVPVTAETVDHIGGFVADAVSEPDDVVPVRMQRGVQHHGPGVLIGVGLGLFEGLSGHRPCR